MYQIKLQEVRKNKKLKQSDLAAILNTKQQIISDYETGKATPSLDRLVEFAIILDVSLDELIQIRKIQKEVSEDIKNK